MPPALSGPVPIPGRPAPAGHYSHAVAHQGCLYIAGQLPVGPAGEIDAALPFAEQATRVLDRLGEVLAAAGSGWGDLLKVDVYIVGIDRWAEFDRIYAARLGPARPARAVIPVPELHHGLALEIAAIAQCPGA